MSILFLIFITLSPFSPLFFRGVDLWYAAGHYFQTGLLILLAYSLFDKSKEIKIRNIPLALITLYLGIMTCNIWYQTLKTGNLNFVVFGPFFNFLCFLIFYKLSFQLDRDNIYRIVRFLGYSICVYLFVCTLQFFDFYPYFKVFAYESTSLHRTVGFIGNESQNGLYLALCLPIFYLIKNRFSILCAVFTWMVIITTQSMSGLVVALTVTIFFSIFHRLPKWYYGLILVGLSVVLWKDFRGYFNPSGRINLWIKMWPLIKGNFIFGSGLGSMNVLARQEAFEGWRHAHNEFYQLLFTAGIIGLVSVLYCIYEYFRKMLKDRLSITLATLFLGFCVASLIYFPCHLWMMSLIAMTSYSFMYVLKNEELNDGFYT